MIYRGATMYNATPRTITAIKLLHREQSLVIGYSNGDIILQNPQSTKTKIKVATIYEDLKIRRLSSAPITTIAARATSTKTILKERSSHTIVIAGHGDGNAIRLFIKRGREKSGWGLKGWQTGAVRPSGESTCKTIAITSENNFAIGSATKLLEYNNAPGQLGKLSKSTHIILAGLLPIIGTNGFVAISTTGDITPHTTKKSLPLPAIKINLFGNAISAIDGVISYDKKNGYSYNLIVLTSAENLLFVKPGTQKTIAANVRIIDVVATDQGIHVGYITNDNNLFYATLAGNTITPQLIKNVQQTNCLAIDPQNQNSKAYIATNSGIETISLVAQIQYTNIVPTVPTGDLISFADDDQQQQPYVMLTDIGKPPTAQQYESMPALLTTNQYGLSSTVNDYGPSLSRESTANNDYSLMENKPSYAKIVETDDKSARFGFYHKLYVIDPKDTGQSGAHLVRCDMLNAQGDFVRFAVAKKFREKAKFEEELNKTPINDNTDCMTTIKGNMRCYGWAYVPAHTNISGKDIQEKWYLFLEYMDQGNGSDLMRFLATNCQDINIKMQIIAGFSHDLLSGLGFLHRNNKYHLDIKPDNFMLADKTQLEDSNKKYDLNDLRQGNLKAKLVDYGLSQISQKTDGNLTYSNGDGKYMSLERLDCYRYEAKNLSATGRNTFNGIAEDAWALGVTFLELLLGYHPFVDGVKNNNGHIVCNGSSRTGGFQARVTCHTHVFFNNIIQQLSQNTPWYQNNQNVPFITLVKGLTDLDENNRIKTLTANLDYAKALTGAIVQPPPRVSDLELDQLISDLS